MSTNGKKIERTLRGVFVRPRVQLIWCSLLSAGFIVLAGFNVVIMIRFGKLLNQLRETFQLDTDTSNLIAGNIFNYLRFALTISVFFALLGVVIGLWLSHKVYGPMVPIAAHVRKMLDGDFSSRAGVRNQDEFKDLAKDLNALAAKLEKKS